MLPLDELPLDDDEPEEFGLEILDDPLDELPLDLDAGLLNSSLDLDDGTLNP